MSEHDTAGSIPVVAIVGRANVGKSTLVNRLIGKREAIEHPEPGVTRDRRGYEVTWRGRRFILMDTGGWEPRARGLTAKIKAQADRAASEADLILLVVDAEVGITDDDIAVARGLRRAEERVIAVANKVDTAAREGDVPAAARLGYGEAVSISALHGRGSGDLLDVIVARLPQTSAKAEADAVNVAIVGRPNVGKSSLFNKMVGEERSIVHDMPGTTRDAVDTVVEWNEKRFRFIDTAGMRRRVRESQGPEYYGLVRAQRVIGSAHVALHVIDIEEGATEQDQKIARMISDAGCAAVLVLNKWDLIDVDDVDQVVADTRDTLRFAPWAQIVRSSALTGRGMKRVLPALESALAAWERRIPTSALNVWARDAFDGLPLGSTTKARPTRIKYVTQARTRPPTFVFQASGEISTSGLRALENRLRESFDLDGTPIRIVARKPAPRAKA